MNYRDYIDAEWREYDTYDFSWNIEFTEGGTLSKFEIKTKAEDTGRFTYESSFLVQNKALKLGALDGGLIPGVTHAFELPIMILAVVSCTIALRFAGRR